MGVNKLILVGNVGRIDIKVLGSSVKVANFSVATTEKYKDRTGVTRDETVWHECVCYGPLAGVCESLVRKGDKVYVEGKLRKRKFTDKSGNEREIVECLVSDVENFSLHTNDNDMPSLNEPF